VCSAFALLKGDLLERQAGGLLLGGFLLGKFAQALIPEHTRILYMCVDVVTCLGLGLIAWRSPKGWPVWATAFFVIGFSTTIARLSGLELGRIAAASATNLSAYGTSITLAIGTFVAWRERDALTEFSIDARRI
jgi:hypothetical protein